MISFTSMQKSYSILQASQLIGVDRHTLTKWIKNGKVVTRKFPNGRYFLTQEDIEKILKGEI